MESVEETRKKKLAQLVRDAGSVAAFAEKLQRSASQVSQWLNSSPDSKTGKPRVLSAQSARMIESAIGKPHGWMDTPILSNEPPAPGRLLDPSQVDDPILRIREALRDLLIVDPENAELLELIKHKAIDAKKRNEEFMALIRERESKGHQY